MVVIIKRKIRIKNSHDKSRYGKIAIVNCKYYLFRIVVALCLLTYIQYLFFIFDLLNEEMNLYALQIWLC